MTVHATDTEVRNDFGFFQDEAMRSPVLISKNGRPDTVLMSYDEFVRLKRNEPRAYETANLPALLEKDLLEATVPDDLVDP